MYFYNIYKILHYYCIIILLFVLFGLANCKYMDGSEILQKNCSYVQGVYANLIRFITKEGFHRDLEDTVEVTVTNSPLPMHHFTTGECSFALLAKFRPDVFVDPYEIKNIPILDESIRVMNNWTDLENPVWQAKSNSTVFIQLTSVPTGNLISTVEVKMPIHFRYQRPMSHSRLKNRLYMSRLATGSLNPGGYHAVSIPLPKLLLRCKDWDTKAVEEKCRTVTTICTRYSAPDDLCSWISVPFKSNSKGNTVFIPVGDSDSQLLITVATLLVVIGGTVFLLMTLIHASNRIMKSNQNPGSTNSRPHSD